LQGPGRQAPSEMASSLLKRSAGPAGELVEGRLRLDLKVDCEVDEAAPGGIRSQAACRPIDQLAETPTWQAQMITPLNVATTTWRTQVCPEAPSRRRPVPGHASTFAAVAAAATARSASSSPTVTPPALVAPGTSWPAVQPPSPDGTVAAKSAAVAASVAAASAQAKAMIASQGSDFEKHSAADLWVPFGFPGEGSYTSCMVAPPTVGHRSEAAAMFRGQCEEGPMTPRQNDGAPKALGLATDVRTPERARPFAAAASSDDCDDCLRVWETPSPVAPKSSRLDIAFEHGSPGAEKHAKSSSVGGGFRHSA